MDSQTDIIKMLVSAVVAFGVGWLTKRPTRVDKDSASWKRIETVVETLQEEMASAKKDAYQLHQDLVASETRSRQLHEDLLSTKSQLIEVKGLLQEAIYMLKTNSIDVVSLEAKLNKGNQ